MVESAIFSLPSYLLGAGLTIGISIKIRVSSNVQPSCSYQSIGLKRPIYRVFHPSYRDNLFMGFDFLST
jgi:hypothetical protein